MDHNIDLKLWSILESKSSTVTIPKAYKDYRIMRHMRWSWQELMEAPWETVEQIWLFMKTEARHAQEENGRERPTTTS